MKLQKPKIRRCSPIKYNQAEKGLVSQAKK
jgi:hypothetical protein